MKMKVQLTFKNKVYDNYQIDDHGIIYDMNGNIQETYIHQGRPTFKKIHVHRYVMHSFKGYQEGMEIHHLNSDKLDNRLENLVYLTKAEHTKLHMEQMTDIQKKKIGSKISKALIGKPRPLEVRQKIAKSSLGKAGAITGRIAVNNGFINKYVYPDNIPEGFIYKGFIKTK